MKRPKLILTRLQRLINIVLWLIVKEVATIPKSEGVSFRKIVRREDALLDLPRLLRLINDIFIFISIKVGFFFNYF